MVTGGSRGIGAAVACRLARDGYAVHLTYRERAARADEVVRTIRATGGRARATRADSSNPTDIDALFTAVDANRTPLAGLVDNAGMLETQRRVEHLDAGRLHRTMAANVIGPMLCAGARCDGCRAGTAVPGVRS